MRITLPVTAYGLHLFSFLVIYSGSGAQWQWSNPKPEGYINTTVVFPDAQNGFILNTNGDMLRTNDQGLTWHIDQNIPFAHSLAYKDFTMIVTAFGAVYVTKDMGQTWEKNRTTSSARHVPVKYYQHQKIKRAFKT